MKTHTKKQRELRNTLIGWLLVMPSLIFMAAFTVWPVFRSIWLSLTKYKLGMSAPEFIGLKNYISLAGSSLFWKVMGNTLFFALITIVPSMVVGLFLATLVNRKSRLIGFVRTSYFYPVVMPMIAIASIWMFIYMAKNGLLDQMLISMGLQPMNILSSKKTVLPAMAFMYVWKEAGYLMVFFLSGIQSISTDVNEAARIDGANSWTIFRKITLPLLAPTFLFVSTIALTNSFKLVDHVSKQRFHTASVLHLPAGIYKLQLRRIFCTDNGYAASAHGSSTSSFLKPGQEDPVQLKEALHHAEKTFDRCRDHRIFRYFRPALADPTYLADRNRIFRSILPYDTVPDNIVHTG